MDLYLKILLILFGLAYMISPVDVIPDLLLPYAGWIDDAIVIWAISHLIRHGKLPGFFFKKTPGAGGAPAPENNSNPGQAHTDRTKKKQADPKKDSPSFKSAHEILGVCPNATPEQIQAAYKEKIKRYHPDKVSQMGKEFSHLANKKFLEIQRAYEILKSK
ncbi:MAG: DnaJ domain-containing protein [Desulfobacteraceae bacterium]|nr:DnaJ domain-containing protein [Desulfobacteraceae bacterium]